MVGEICLPRFAFFAFHDKMVSGKNPVFPLGKPCKICFFPKRPFWKRQILHTTQQKRAIQNRRGSGILFHEETAIVGKGYVYGTGENRPCLCDLPAEVRGGNRRPDSGGGAFRRGVGRGRPRAPRGQGGSPPRRPADPPGRAGGAVLRLLLPVPARGGFHPGAGERFGFRGAPHPGVGGHKALGGGLPPGAGGPGGPAGPGRGPGGRRPA